MGRNSLCSKQKVRKGLWSPEEDEKLYNYIARFGVGSWSSVPKFAGLQRCGKSCRLRWINYLRPDLKRGMFSQEEEDLIISLHEALGNRWAQIAAQLPGRTDNEIKNFWNSSLKKKLIKQGIDPNTHKPITEIETRFHQPKGLPNLATPSQVEQQIITYDPLYLPDFQANVENEHYYQSRGVFVNNLSNLDHNNSMMVESSSTGAHMDVSNMVENGGIMSWGPRENYKFDPFFRFEVEEKRPSTLWQEGTQSQRFDDQESSGGVFCNYTLAAFSQGLPGVNLDVYNQI